MFGIRTKFRHSTISIVLTVSVTKRIFSSYNFFSLLYYPFMFTIIPKCTDGDFKFNAIVFEKC